LVRMAPEKKQPIQCAQDICPLLGGHTLGMALGYCDELRMAA